MQQTRDVELSSGSILEHNNGGQDDYNTIHFVYAMPYKFCIVAAMTYCFLMVVWLIVDTIHFVYAMPNEYCNVVTMAYCFVMVVWLIIDTIHFKYAML